MFDSKFDVVQPNVIQGAVLEICCKAYLKYAIIEFLVETQGLLTYVIDRLHVLQQFF